MADTALSVLSSIATTLYTLAMQERDNQEQIVRLQTHTLGLYNMLRKKYQGGVPRDVLILLKPLNRWALLPTSSRNAALY